MVAVPWKLPVRRRQKSDPKLKRILMSSLLPRHRKNLILVYGRLIFCFCFKILMTFVCLLQLLRVQNRRLAERLHQRQRIETELHSRIEQMEKKQLNEDTKLYVINRYWNQLNEDMRLLLERFEESEVPSGGGPSDSPTLLGGGTSSGSITNGDPSNDMLQDCSDAASSFLRQLANCDKEELDESLQQRVLLSTRAVSKVLAAFDRITARNEKIMKALKTKNVSNENEKPADGSKSPKKEGDSSSDSENNNMKTVRNKLPAGGVNPDVVAQLNESLKDLTNQLVVENKNLTLVNTGLHEKYRTTSLKYAEMQDKLEMKDTQVDELKIRIDELEFELNKSRTREQRLEDHLYETREKLRDLQSGVKKLDSDDGSSGASLGQEASDGSSIISGKLEDLKRELEEQRELAAARLVELEQMNNDYKEALKSAEKYKMELQCIPMEVIHESAEYKSLKSHYSVLFNESSQLQTQLTETQASLLEARTLHQAQIDQMESEELNMQKELRDEWMETQNKLYETKKE